jgi:ribokinase
MNVARVPAAGETVGDATFASGPGGKASNQAIAIRRLGIAAELLTIIGPDDHGRQLLELWADEGVATDSVVVGRAHTMIGSILVDRSGENRIVVAPGALDELTEDVLAAFSSRIEQASALLASLEVPTSTVVAALAQARACGVPTVLNPAPAASLRPTDWSAVDHVTPNRTEAAALTMLDVDAPVAVLADGLRRIYAGVIVITLGSDGVFVDDRTRREHVPAVLVAEVIDSTGAGDAFSAAYTAALVEGAEPIDAARFATYAGAFAVTREQVIPGLPTRADLDLPITALDLT